MTQEPPNKVRRLNNQLSEFSFDFAEIFPHISEEIFSYLAVSDLLECSLVSKQWHKLIGAKPELMAKIKVKIDETLDPEAWDLFENSSRSYQNIEIVNAEINQFYVEFFEKNGGHWKFVKFLDNKFESEETISSILKSVEPTIEQLLIEENGFISFDGDIEYPDRTFVFQKLKKLKVKWDTFPMGFFARCKTLTFFDVVVEYVVDIEEVDEIQQILQRNADLKKVVLKGNDLGGVSDDKLWRNVTFQLDELHVDLNSAPPPFMAQFLETQVESLITLTINDGMDLNCLEVIFRMRKLKRLCIENYFQGGFPEPWNLNWDEIELPQNCSIESLDNDGVNNQNMIKVFVRALPNIKHLKIYAIGNDIFEFLSTNTRNLESLECVFFEITPDLYLARNPFPSLKTL